MAISRVPRTARKRPRGTCRLSAGDRGRAPESTGEPRRRSPPGGARSGARAGSERFMPGVRVGGDPTMAPGGQPNRRVPARVADGTWPLPPQLEPESPAGGARGRPPGASARPRPGTTNGRSGRAALGVSAEREATWILVGRATRARTPGSAPPAREQPRRRAGFVEWRSGGPRGPGGASGGDRRGHKPP